MIFRLMSNSDCWNNSKRQFFA